MATQFKDTYSVLISLRDLKQDITDVVWDNLIGNNELMRDPEIHSGNPIEDDPHVTVLMGLEKNDIGPAVMAISHTPKFKLRITDFGHFVTNKKFDNGKTYQYDVLYRNVVGDDLLNFHKKVSTATGKKWHFPEYKTHATYAYMKYQSSQKYMDKLNQTIQEIEIPVEWVVIKKFQSSEPAMPYKLGTSLEDAEEKKL